MQQRNLLAIVAGLALIAGLRAQASAQNQAPFTIRYPPDGATVREAVPIRVPLASIPETGYVAFSFDGQFRVALAPSDTQRKTETEAARKARRPAMFTYVWNTKAPVKVKGKTEEEVPADGEHEISATLFDGSSARQTSSVRVTVANKIAGNPGPISLRYRYVDGSSLNYLRDGQTSIVAGLTQGAGGSEDQELVGMKGDLLYAVEDRYPNGHAIVRNKLTNLEVRQNGQETRYPSNQLPQSLYQEVDSRGQVHYQNDTVSFDQFAQLGIPVSTTLELPELPLDPKAIGDKWRTANVSLDLPGTSPSKQPRVTVENTLVDLEWEGGYRTARIHQHYDSAQGGLKEKQIVFGTMLIDAPHVVFDRDVYVAYGAGRLIKIDRKLNVTGKTAGNIPGSGIPGGPGALGGPMGLTGPGGTTAPMGMGMPGGMSPYGPGMGMEGPGGPMGMGAPGGLTAPMGMGMGMGGRRGGMAGMSGMFPGRGGRGRRGGYAGSGMPGSGMPGSGYPMGRAGGYVGGTSGTGQQGTQITLKSTSTTELDTQQARLASGR